MRRGYDTLFAALDEIEPRSKGNFGAWSLPNGAAYYADRLKTSTTTTLTSDQIHDLGLAQVAAGGGRTYSGALEKLEPGSRIYAYQKGAGYVGFGTVTGSAVMARDAVIDGRALFNHDLAQPNINHDADDAENAEYVVRVEWLKEMPLAQATTFPGVFANQNVVCRLRDAATLDFLQREFGPTE